MTRTRLFPFYSQHRRRQAGIPSSLFPQKYRHSSIFDHQIENFHSTKMSIALHNFMNEFHLSDFIELRKISSLNPKENPLFSAWVQFLGAKSASELEAAAHSIPEINQLVGQLNKISADKEFIDLLNKNEVDRVIAQRTNAQALRDAWDEGRAEALLNSIHTILSRKMSVTRDALVNRMSHCTITELESLLSAALDFTSPADLDAWEKSNPPHGS